MVSAMELILTVRARGQDWWGRLVRGLKYVHGRLAYDDVHGLLYYRAGDDTLAIIIYNTRGLPHVFRALGLVGGEVVGISTSVTHALVRLVEGEGGE